MDVGGRLAGSLSGSMNMMVNPGGAVGPVVVGYILTSTKVSPDAPNAPEGWTLAFLVAAAIYGIGALAWLFIDPVRRSTRRARRGRRRNLNRGDNLSLSSFSYSFSSESSAALLTKENEKEERERGTRKRKEKEDEG